MSLIFSFVSGFIRIETTPIITIQGFPLPSYWKATEYVLPSGEIIIPKEGEVIELKGIDSVLVLEQIAHPSDLGGDWPWKVEPHMDHAEKKVLIVQYRSLGEFKGEQFIYSLIITAVYTSGRENRKFSIISATLQDINGIIELQEQLLLQNNSTAINICDKGFLVNRVGADQLTELLASSDMAIILIAKNSSKAIIGYSISYDGKYFLDHNPQWPIYSNVPAQIRNTKFLYGKHLASDRSLPGVGSSLNASTFSWGKERGYKLYIGEICEGPVVNIRSLKKHVDEQGFTRFSGYTDTKGFSWGIYGKNL